MIKFGKIEIISPLENNEKMKIKLENNFMESAPKLMEKMMKNAAIKIQEERDQDIIDTLIKKTGIEFKNSDELYYFIKNYNEIKMPYSYEHKNNKILIPANCLIKS